MKKYLFLFIVIILELVELMFRTNAYTDVWAYDENYDEYRFIEDSNKKKPLLYNYVGKDISDFCCVACTNSESYEYPNAWNIELTEDEIELLAKIVWIESRGEDDWGQRAVVEVIFNRIISVGFPNTLYGVISQPTHFASFPIIDSAMPGDREYENINYVLNCEVPILPMNYVYFSRSTHTNHNGLIVIGNHQFCNEY